MQGSPRGEYVRRSLDLRSWEAASELVRGWEASGEVGVVKPEVPIYNASGPEPMLVAEGLESEPLKVYDRGVWTAVQRRANE